MVDPIKFRRFLFRCLFLLVCAVLIFAKMLPLGTEPAATPLIDPVTGETTTEGKSTLFIPGPDLIFAMMSAWIIRRPRWAPIGLIVAVLLLTDLLFLKPIGLWTAIGLLGLEFIRSRAHGATEMPWPVEIAIFAGVFTASIFANAIFFLVFNLPSPGLLTLLLHIIMTVAAYPFVLLVTHYVLRVRRARPTDFDAIGGVA